MIGKADIGASVRARLLNRAKAQGIDFNLVLTRFALERLLYRLSVSEHRDRFVLKGALLFDLWFDVPHRPTRDVDFLGFGSADIATLEATFRDISGIGSDDGMTFDSSSIRAIEIRNEANYPGVRVTLFGMLSGARIAVQADVGFGDAVTPGPTEVEYPVMLEDLPPPRLTTYPKQTVIAEKFEAIASLGMSNSRMKDYFDLWVLTRQPDASIETLAEAVQATFERRKTPLPGSIPLGLSDEFAVDKTKLAQWSAFVKRNKLDAPSLTEVVAMLRDYWLSIVIKTYR